MMLLAEEKNVDFNIVDIRDIDQQEISDFLVNNLGSPRIVSRGQLHEISQQPGFYCKHYNEIIGLITYHIQKDECEILSLNSSLERKGLGTRLLNEVIKVARQNQCKRVGLVTTNDNYAAIRFFQKRGFEWVGFYPDSMKNARELKPEIPEKGMDGIPIKHELEFEMLL
ncbi:MAG: GNAT family N-acetyltransferase [Candidatus Cyclobacteriaceae bacterium M3_2C_046]